MNDTACLGLDFLAKCSQSNLTDHFLFNLETAVSSLAIIVAIYALFLERRFRVRIGLKNTQLKNLIFLVFIVIELTFVAATLAYVPGVPRPLVGYPIFWEIVAFLLLIVAIFQAYNLQKPIRKLSKKQVDNLIKSAPYDTIGYHGSVDLMVREADYFWADFLEKSLVNKDLRRVLIEDFTNEDFLKVAVKSQYILLQTVEALGKAKPTENTTHIKDYLRTFFLFSMSVEDSVISNDLKSSYKPIMQHIMRKRKLADVILGDSTDLFLFRCDLEGNQLNVLERFVKILELHLGRQYHRTEDKSENIKLIHPNVLKNLLDFFNESMPFLKKDEKGAFMQKFSFMHLDLKSLPQNESEILANGVYEILETYSSGRDWSKDYENERHLCIQIEHHFVEQNQYTKKVFKQRLLEQIVGCEEKDDDGKKVTRFICNLKGYYPMMVPAYFFTYGHNLFCKKVPAEDFEFNMTILKKMQENLPKIASGRTQGFLDKELPKNERTLSAIKRKAERCLESMFPDNMVYDKEANSLTYYFSGDEDSSTLLLNETVKQNKFVFKELE